MGSVVRVNQEQPSPAVLEEASRTLAAGGVVVLPTDSVYGIGCAAMSGNPGHERIFAIKRRERSQTLPWLVADASDLLVYGHGVPGWALRLADDLWPGALTLVVAASSSVPVEYRAANGTVALRVPDSTLVRELARRVGPLATTSANTHGQEAATSGTGIEPRIVEQADLTLDAGPAPVGQASTIVDCTCNTPRILREGALAGTLIVRMAGRACD